MLLTIDCGNTHLCFGLYAGNQLLRSWRISTNTSRTEDEYLVLLEQLLLEAGYHLRDIDGMIVGSVVPSINVSLNKLAYKYLKCRPYFVDHTTPMDLEFHVDHPSELGADRIINALAAYQKYGGNLIVVDFGTATTFDCISKEGAYEGGAICPGVEISQQALFSRAARLANIELRRPPSVIGKNTADSLRSGLLWGYGGQVDALVNRMKDELGEDARVVATGGWATFIRNFCDTIDLVDTQLTLDGLRMIWERNCVPQKDD